MTSMIVAGTPALLKRIISADVKTKFVFDPRICPMITEFATLASTSSMMLSLVKTVSTGSVAAGVGVGAASGGGTGVTETEPSGRISTATFWWRRSRTYTRV